MNEIHRDEAGIRWRHQVEEKLVREGTGKRAARFLWMDREKDDLS